MLAAIETKTEQKRKHAATFFDRYGAALKYWGNWGFAGLICGWLFMVELPAIRHEGTQRELSTAEREDRRMKDYRDERREGLKHATDAVDVLGQNLRLVQSAVEQQTRTLIELQTITHKNQERLIESKSIGKSATAGN